MKKHVEKIEHKKFKIRKSHILLILGIIIVLAGIAYMTFFYKPAQIVGDGDTVYVSYVGRLQNGTVFDTNVKEVAESNGMKKSSYDSLKFRVGAGQMIKGFDNAVLGMKVGEKKTVTLPPDQAYGYYDANKTVKLPKEQEIERYQQLPRTVEISFEDFVNNFGQAPQTDTAFHVEGVPGTFMVSYFDKDNVTVLRDMPIGSNFTLPGTKWPSFVVNKTSDSIILRQDPENGMELDTGYGPAIITHTDDKVIMTLSTKVGDYVATKRGNLKVVGDTGKELLLDANHPLANQTLVFDIELVKLEKKLVGLN